MNSIKDNHEARQADLLNLDGTDYSKAGCACLPASCTPCTPTACWDVYHAWHAKARRGHVRLCREPAPVVVRPVLLKACHAIWLHVVQHVIDLCITLYTAPVTCHCVALQCKGLSYSLSRSCGEASLCRKIYMLNEKAHYLNTHKQRASQETSEWCTDGGPHPVRELTAVHGLLLPGAAVV